MNQNTSSTPPPQTSVTIIQKIIVAYKLWHEYLPHFPKSSRYNLGAKLDSLFLESIVYLFAASRKSKENKLADLNWASNKLDLMKFLLQIAWEVRSLDNKKYIALSEKLDEIGKMLGGWRKQTESLKNQAR